MAVLVGVFARAETASCPDCGDTATRVHSRYERRLADVPVGGRQLMVRLRVRRWLCDGVAWAIRTFAEQLERVTVRDGRWTQLLRTVLERIADGAGRACRVTTCWLAVRSGQPVYSASAGRVFTGSICRDTEGVGSRRLPAATRSR